MEDTFWQNQINFILRRYPCSLPIPFEFKFQSVTKAFRLKYSGEKNSVPSQNENIAQIKDLKQKQQLRSQIVLFCSQEAGRDQ